MSGEHDDYYLCPDETLAVARALLHRAVAAPVASDPDPQTPGGGPPID